MGLETPALDEQPILDVDLQRLLEEFNRLSRGRPASMGKAPQAIPLADLIAGWEMSFARRAGMPKREYVELMQDLDAELIDFYIKRNG